MNMKYLNKGTQRVKKYVHIEQILLCRLFRYVYKHYLSEKIAAYKRDLDKADKRDDL